MKYQSFIMRVLCLLLIVGAVLGYNSMQKKDSDTEKDQQIASLTTRVEALEKQQDEILSALEEVAKAQEEAKKKAEEEAKNQKAQEKESQKGHYRHPVCRYRIKYRRDFNSSGGSEQGEIRLI